MIILQVKVPVSIRSIQTELPHPNMVIDPRVNNRDCKVRRVACVYHPSGTTVTLVRIGDMSVYIDPEDTFTLQFRAYDPATETVPNFESTMYHYLGVDGEKAPLDTTVLVIDQSVKVIKKEAFQDCMKIRKCFMHDNVHTIEERAFCSCEVMTVVTLSRNLKEIGEEAFFECMSLVGIFLPSTLETIGLHAFAYCKSLSILSLPPNINLLYVGDGVVNECQTLFENDEIVKYGEISDSSLFEPFDWFCNNEKVHQSILNYNHKLPHLHKACLATDITSQTIDDLVICTKKKDTEAVSSDTDAHADICSMAMITHHHGKTPLHVLAINPHSDEGALITCFHSNTYALFTRDDLDMTPLDYLRTCRHRIDDHTALVLSLCMMRRQPYVT